MKKSFKTLVLLLSLGLLTSAQAPSNAAFQLTQVAVEQTQNQIDLQFNNPTQSKLTLVLRGVDGHIVYKKKWKNTKSYHGQFNLNNFPAGTYLLEMENDDTLVSRDRIVICAKISE